MDKRYQVFISSTFADLEDERKEIMQAIIELNCFPAGMEMFPATDSEQFEYIKTIIDDSDYYVLVVAGRYGSVADDGVSYTEKEFDYAKEKGVPILAFVKNNIKNIPVDKTDDDSKKARRLKAFRSKVLDGRMVSFWDTAAELKYNIHSSLSKQFKMHPRIGWVKGNIIPSYEALEKLNQLQEKNKQLMIKLQNYDINKESDSDYSSKISKIFAISIEPEIFFDKKEIYDTSIKSIINKTGLILRNGVFINQCKRLINEKIVNSNICEFSTGTITEDSLEDIEKRLLALGIIDMTDFGDNIMIKLTDYGEEVFIQSIEF